MEEIWKRIPDYPEYEISNFGNVRSYILTKPNKGIPHIIKPCNNKGYKRVTLCKNKTHKSFMIHVLVLKTFIDDKPPGKEACHNNGNPLDNHLENLRWDTRQENVNDRAKHNKTVKGERINTNKLSTKQVVKIRFLYNQGISAQNLSEQFSIHIRTIYKIINKDIWKHI